MAQEPVKTVGQRIREEIAEAKARGVDIEQGVLPKPSAENTEEAVSLAATNSSPQPPRQPPPPLGKYEYPPRPLPNYAISKGVPPPPCYKGKIGRFYVYSWDKNGDPRCM